MSYADGMYSTGKHYFGISTLKSAQKFCALLNV